MEWFSGERLPRGSVRVLPYAGRSVYDSLKILTLVSTVSSESDSQTMAVHSTPVLWGSFTIEWFAVPTYIRAYDNASNTCFLRCTVMPVSTTVCTSAPTLTIVSVGSNGDNVSLFHKDMLDIGWALAPFSYTFFATFVESSSKGFYKPTHVPGRLPTE